MIEAHTNDDTMVTTRTGGLVAGSETCVERAVCYKDYSQVGAQLGERLHFQFEGSRVSPPKK